MFEDFSEGVWGFFFAVREFSVPTPFYLCVKCANLDEIGTWLYVGGGGGVGGMAQP